MRPQKAHLPFLDQLRGLAIIFVFAYHALFQAFRRDELEWHGWFRDFNAPSSFLAVYPVTWGWCGVPIFFAISGFCIHLSYSNSRDANTTDFLVRRWFRIYPPFLLALIFFAFVFPHSRVDLNTKYGIAEFLSHLFLVHNLDVRSLHGINVAWWSIAVEFQLYLLYPLLLAGVRRFGWQTMTGLTAVVEIGMRVTDALWVLTNHAPLPTYWVDLPFYFWFSWTAGAVVAEAYIKNSPYPFDSRYLPLWIALAITADLFKPLSYFSFTFVALATAAALVGFLQRNGAPLRLNRASSAHLYLAGLCSYSLYLIHLPIEEVVPGIAVKMWPALSQQPMALFLVVLSSWLVILPVAWLMYRWIETSATSLGKTVVHLRRRRSSVRVQASIS
jgi:peptidoglycan/LPS O-acetylase OafA/YrhL